MLLTVAVFPPIIPHYCLISKSHEASLIFINFERLHKATSTDNRLELNNMNSTTTFIKQKHTISE